MKQQILGRTLLACIALLILTACGAATYDYEKPEESLQSIMQDMSPDEKTTFYRAFQQVLMHELTNRNQPLLALASLAVNPSEARQYTMCMNGKTAEEIIEMATRFKDTSKSQSGKELQVSANSYKFWAEEVYKKNNNFENKTTHTLAELEHEIDTAKRNFDKNLQTFEKEVEQAAYELKHKLDAAGAELDNFEKQQNHATLFQDEFEEIDKEIKGEVEKTENELYQLEQELNQTLDELEREIDNI